MNARGWWIIAGFLCLPMATAAQELTLGIGAEGKVYTNRPSTSSDSEDYIIRITPDAILEDKDGELQWKLQYRPDYERFLKTSERSGFTHRVDGKMTWRIDPATSVEVSEQFGFFESVSRYNETVTEDPGEQVVEAADSGFQEDQSIRNTVSARLTRKLTPRQSLSFRLGHYLIDYDREARLDRETLSAAGNYAHTVSNRSTLGGGISYRRSSLEGGAAQTDQSTDFYNLFATWNHKFDETLTLSVALGPTWVVGEDRNIRTSFRGRTYPLLTADGETRLVRASSCPTEDGYRILTGDCDTIDEDLLLLDLATFNLANPFAPGVLEDWNPTRDLRLVDSPPSSSNESLTYFANIRLSKSWERWTGSIAYVRQQSDSSGLGSSAVADILSGILDWKPSPRWQYTLKASLTRQTSATEGLSTVIVVESVNLNAAPPPGYLVGNQFSDVARAVGIQAVEIEQDIEYLTFWLRFDARYRATKRTTLFANFSYWHQERDGLATNALGDYDRFRFNFGVRYTFDPIRF